MSQAGSVGGGTITPGTYIQTITGDVGGAVSSDGAGNINIVTGQATNNAGATVFLDGNAGTNTITLEVTDAAGNTLVGASAGNLTLTGASNTALGRFAGLSLTNGSNNVALGDGAMSGATTTADNVIIGVNAGTGASSTTYARSVGVGYRSLNGGGGGNNTAVGSNAAESLDGNCTDNVIIGYAAAQQLTLTSDGNVIIGSGAAPTLLTATNNNIMIGTNAGASAASPLSSNIYIANAGSGSESNTIRIGTQGSGTGEQNLCFVAGIAGVSVSNALTVVIDSTTGQLGTSGDDIAGWVVVTGASQTLSAGTGYIANNAGTINFSLPATAGVGDTFRITGINNATGWQVTQAAGQQIFIGTASTTAGVGGSLTSSATRDSIEIICIVANTTFQVVSMVGNITVV